MSRRTTGGPRGPSVTQGLPPLRETIARFGLSARKSLGQHFLLDANLTARIARAAAPLEGYTVLEVGPGPGGLTRALLSNGASRIIAIERDARCVVALDELAKESRNRLVVVEADALAVDEASLVSGPAKVVANLPYNISVALLLKWLQAPRRFESYTLMFQKEVASRLVAEPGGRDYGRLSVKVQWLCEARRLFDVNPKAFTPPPKVTSTVVQLVPRAEPLCPADPVVLEHVTAAAFGQRRKMLRAALKTLGPDPDGLLRSARIDPTARAETLTIAQFCALSRAFSERTDG